MSLLAPELLRRLEQFQLLAARRVKSVVLPAPWRRRILRRVLSHRKPSVIRKFSTTNQHPVATGISTSELLIIAAADHSKPKWNSSVTQHASAETLIDP